MEIIVRYLINRNLVLLKLSLRTATS